MYGIVSDIILTRSYSFFFSICPEYKIQGQYGTSTVNRTRTTVRYEYRKGKSRARPAYGTRTVP